MLALAVFNATEAAAPSPGSDCDRVFTFVADYVERNYAGFRDKVSEKNRGEYDEHRAELRARSGAAADRLQCQEILREYTGFFRDPHLSVWLEQTQSGVPQDDAAIRARFADWPVRKIPEAQVRAYLDLNRNDLDPIEGIWEIVGSDYRIAILPDESAPGGYEAVTLRSDGVWWTPGQIKATFERSGPGEFDARYYMRDHSLREETARMADGLLVIDGLSTLAQVYPGNPSQYDLQRYRDWEAGRQLTIREMANDTLLLRLPTFEATAEAEIKKLVEDNWARLSSVENLIIDVRGNQGGGVGGYHPLRPLLYTGPIMTPGVAHYATSDNIRVIQDFIDDTPITEQLTDVLEEIVAGMRDHLGTHVPTPDDIYEIDGALDLPRRIAVLTDHRCISTCEAFVWAAVQSGKVTTFGRNTGGFMDYGSALPIEVPGSDFWLQMPMSRSNRVLQGTPLDNVGIEPHVRVPAEVLYWVDWVREQLRSL